MASAVATALALSVTVAACGGSSSGGSGKVGGTVTVLMGTAPDSLDPGIGATTQSYEATWLAYTGLVTYAHDSGEAGAKLIPGVAEALPTVTADGKTYAFKLRKGLRYSSGDPVKAADFAHTIERTIKLGWGNASFLSENIVGGEAYAQGKAHSIAGIHTDEATGTIKIDLNAPYGPFLNVLAFPAAGLVPSSTPMHASPNEPPPGVGAYEIVHVVPNKSFSLLRNPNFTASTIPGVPAAKADVAVQIVSNDQSEAEQVLSNQADVFDYNDTIPSTLLAQVQSQAASRFAKESTVSGEYFFLNVKEKPFSSEKVRQAVEYALDRRALQRLDSGMLEPACFFLPSGMPGHPNASCPYGQPNSEIPAANMAKAKELVQSSGLAGASVTVWGGSRAPHKEYVDYYASVLNEIGLKASVKIVADAQYYATVGNTANHPQTGWMSFSQDFPNPIDFYQLLDAKSIIPNENHNLSQVADPHVQAELAALGPVPSSQLPSVVGRWQALDQYTAQHAYVATFGYDQAPKFFSDRVAFGTAVFHPVYGNDWSTLELK
ncbi:MAG TPA: ABC transporter substrate-binding protein [Solirubrobacteraceae bacterium]|jgi:peptide/nickel transport system substrate-binding protein|nr:ABC transporter substrate-binding protein [Solirubrobacteraceae bacterium]